MPKNQVNSMQLSINRQLGTNPMRIIAIFLFTLTFLATLSARCFADNNCPNNVNQQSLQSPLLSNAEIIAFANEAISYFNSFDYRKTQLEQAQLAQRYFTPSYWKKYVKATQSSVFNQDNQSIQTVYANKEVYSPTIGPIKIITQGLVKNVYTWQVAANVTLNITSNQRQIQQQTNYVLTISRTNSQPPSNDFCNRGVAITHIDSKPA